MIYNGKEIEFPAITKISFFKVAETFEKMASDADPNVKAYGTELLDLLKTYPILMEGFDDMKLIEKYRPQMEQLLRPLFPDALMLNEIKGATAPFHFDPFYTSTRFGNIIKAASDDFKFELTKTNENVMYRMACTAILGFHYGYYIDNSKPLLVEIPNVDTGISKMYRIAFNADLMDFTPAKKAPKITEADYKLLLNNYDDFDLWKEKFPPFSWIMRGIGLVNMMDVTMDHSITSFTSNLLIKSEDSFSKITSNLQTLMNLPDLKVSFVGIEGGAFISHNKKEFKSFILGDDDNYSCEKTFCPHGYKQLIESNEAFTITDVEEYAELSKSHGAENLLKASIRSYIIAPLIHEEEFLGFLELGHPNKFALSTAILEKIEDVLPILTMAIKRFKAEEKNQIEAIIQQECTTIHPSVKWKFEDKAQKYLKKLERKENAVFKDIVFSEVYPLYGQIDIKGSSKKRNDAVTTDLSKQLSVIGKLLSTAFKKFKLPILEELIYRVSAFKVELKEGLQAGSEHDILSFINEEINPVLNKFKENKDALAKAVTKYYSQLSTDMHMIYESRRDFDESVSILNYGLASFLDQKQLEAQAMFPHYFERYKTDGLEYNIYMGQSIVKDLKFDPLYLRNLRLWQLLVSCELELEFNRLKSELKTPLEVASLILVYSSPMAIHFRMDEKRFDVEGAYNARYEIVKKRVDKAHIKGTNDRVTIPGKLAIVYSNEADAKEYRRYLNFIAAKGLIDPVIEDLELEDLQGITGLHALRATLNYGTEQQSEPVNLDEFIASIA